MNKFRIAILSLAAVTVAACAGPQTASRNATHDVAPGQVSSVSGSSVDMSSIDARVFVPNISISKITIDVPRKLKVSEKNSYVPKGDIIWRGDAIGDRHEQVRAIFVQSAQNAGAKLQGASDVHLHIQATRFHGVSEKARYRVGGVHNVNFFVTLLDPTTGATIRPARHVVSNLDAFGGDDAIAADARGETQKRRVTDFLTQVIYTELTQPKGYVDNNSGLFVALNRN